MAVSGETATGYSSQGVGRGNSSYDSNNKNGDDSAGGDNDGNDSGGDDVTNSSGESIGNAPKREHLPRRNSRIPTSP